MIYAYIRVSTDLQTVENQRYEIEKFCKLKNLKKPTYIEETISGTTPYYKRKLGRILSKLKQGDILIASELTRLGRSLYMVMTILNICMTKGITVMTIKDNFTLSDNIESKVLAFAFGLSAEIERKLISERTREALARIKAEGKTLGRPKGKEGKRYKLGNKIDQLEWYLAHGRSKAWIARKFKVHPNTIYQYLRAKKSQNL